MHPVTDESQNEEFHVCNILFIKAGRGKRDETTATRGKWEKQTKNLPVQRSAKSEDGESTQRGCVSSRTSSQHEGKVKKKEQSSATVVERRPHRQARTV
jgi:hypothetical protein